MNNEEVWKSISGLEGHYEASNLGRVRSIKNGGCYVMAQQVVTGKKDYRTVMITVDGKYAPQLVHRLVLQAFAGPCPAGMEACHNNGIARDNRPENLRWDTHKANCADQALHGTHRNTLKTRCVRGHEFTPENTYTRPGGQRNCKQCNQDKSVQAMAARGGRRKPGAKSKLTLDQREELRRLRAEGATFQSLANRYGINISSAHSIANRAA